MFHHNDGGIRSIIPAMIDAGIDIPNPIQWKCAGMDRRELKRTFGERILFHGAIDNQHTLPFGSSEDVHREVLENLDILDRTEAISSPHAIDTVAHAAREHHHHVSGRLRERLALTGKGDPIPSGIQKTARWTPTLPCSSTTLTMTMSSDCCERVTANWNRSTLESHIPS